MTTSANCVVKKAYIGGLLHYYAKCSQCPWVGEYRKNKTWATRDAAEHDKA